MTEQTTTLAQVVQLIWSEHEISRAEIARRLDLSRSTVSALVQQLLDQGTVIEARVGQSGGGRPPVMLRFAHDRYRVVGIDLGASHATAVVMDPRGHLLARASQRHPVEHDPAGTLALIERLVTQVLRDAGVRDDQVLGIGVAVPSPVHSRRPGHLSPSILPAWKDVDLGGELAARWGVPAYLENDANLGALGELVWGRGRGAGDFAYVKLATGVGAGLIVNGELYRGAEGIAGEIGHTAIDPSGPPCRCGLRGCLEAMIGSHAVETRYRDACQSQGRAPADTDLGAIARQAAAGDDLARDVIAQVGRYLGIGLANLLNIVNPSRIVLGGRLTLAGDALLQPLQAAIQARAMWTNVAAADVVTSTLDDDAIPLGAGTLVLRTALAEPRRFQLGLPMAARSLPLATSDGLSTSL